MAPVRGQQGLDVIKDDKRGLDKVGGLRSTGTTSTETGTISGVRGLRAMSSESDFKPKCGKDAVRLEGRGSTASSVGEDVKAKPSQASTICGIEQRGHLRSDFTDFSEDAYIPDEGPCSTSTPPGLLGDVIPADRLSRGSKLHATGRCTPCAWFWKAQSCRNGQDCNRCHMCPEGEVKVRRAARVADLKAAAAVAAVQRDSLEAGALEPGLQAQQGPRAEVHTAPAQAPTSPVTKPKAKDKSPKSPPGSWKVTPSFSPHVKVAAPPGLEMPAFAAVPGMPAKIKKASFADVGPCSDDDDAWESWEEVSRKLAFCKSSPKPAPPPGTWSAWRDKEEAGLTMPKLSRGSLAPEHTGKHDPPPGTWRQHKAAEALREKKTNPPGSWGDKQDVQSTASKLQKSKAPNGKEKPSPNRVPQEEERASKVPPNGSGAAAQQDGAAVVIDESRAAIVRLGEERRKESAMTEGLPSIGSIMHDSGLCQPCGWFWKPQGCQNGLSCGRCHMCPASEVKKRKHAKKAALRAQDREDTIEEEAEE